MLNKYIFAFAIKKQIPDNQYVYNKFKNSIETPCTENLG